MITTVVLTRESPHDDDLAERLGDRCRILRVPLTETTYAELDEVRTRVATCLKGATATAVALTSARAATFIGVGLDAATPTAWVGVVGPATEAAVRVALGDRSVTVKAAPERSGTSLASLFDAGPVLWLAGERRRPEFEAALAAKGVEVAVATCYDAHDAPLGGLFREELSLAEVVVISSPAAWTHALKSVRRGAVVVAMGPLTADAVRVTHPLVEVAGEDLGATISAVLDRLESDPPLGQ
jgi:uroporphyrinogen-III synthase